MERLTHDQLFKSGVSQDPGTPLGDLVALVKSYLPENAAVQMLVVCGDCQQSVILWNIPDYNAIAFNFEQAAKSVRKFMADRN